MRTALGDRYAESFDGMPSHKPRQSVLEAAASARDAKADLVVTFGGGSGTDAGKMVRLALKHDIRAIEDFDRFVVRVAADGSRALLDYEPPDVPQIAIPTTLSGGDFNPSAGATDTRTMLKEIYRHPRLVPSVIILDPAVTVRTPQWLWLSSGIRALDHAVETGLRTVGRRTVAAGGDPGDFPARRRVAANASRSKRSRGSVGCTTRGVAVDGTQPFWHPHGREPRHRSRTGRDLQRSAWLYILRHAAGGAAVQ